MTSTLTFDLSCARSGPRTCVRMLTLISFLLLSSSPAVVESANSLEVGGFGAPVLGVAQLGDGAAMLTGGEAGLVLNKRWHVGVSLFGSLRLPGVEARAGSQFVSFWQGGALVRHEFGDGWRVHPRLGVVLGAAYVQLTAAQGLAGASLHFAAEPRVGVGIEVARFLHIGADVGYRFIAPVVPGLRFDQTSGVSGVITAAFGWF